MKLATILTAAGPKPAALADNRWVDLSAAGSKPCTTLLEILAQPGGLDRARQVAESGRQTGPFVDGRPAAPIPRPGKVICIGLNYRDHARESGQEPPPEPVVFCKFPTSVIGPGDTVRLPAVCQQVDYEAELVVVVGKAGKNIPREQAFEHVAGYMNGNDVSARDWQHHKPGKQWLMGKTPDTFAPCGPWLVTADEVPDPHNLRVRLRLNGQTMQDSFTKELIFGVDALIAYISQLVTIEPGDVLFTGTPPGVGAARKPPVFLKPGDVCEVEIDGLGILKNPIAAEG